MSCKRGRICVCGRYSGCAGVGLRKSGLRELLEASSTEECELCVGLGSSGRGKSTVGRGGMAYECSWSLGCRSWCGYVLIGSAFARAENMVMMYAGSEVVQRAESGIDGRATRTTMHLKSVGGRDG